MLNRFLFAFIYFFLFIFFFFSIVFVCRLLLVGNFFFSSHQLVACTLRLSSLSFDLTLWNHHGLPCHFIRSLVFYFSLFWSLRCRMMLQNIFVSLALYVYLKRLLKKSTTCITYDRKRERERACIRRLFDNINGELISIRSDKWAQMFSFSVQDQTMKY